LESLAEKYGQLLLSQIFTQVWYGNWNEFEETIEQLPTEWQEQFPFYEVYNRKETKSWHEHYFNIPGEYFIPPYLSSYQKEEVQAKESMKNDFYNFIERFDNVDELNVLREEEFSDHIGSLTAFVTIMISLEIKAIQENNDVYMKDLQHIREHFCKKHLKPGVDKLWETYKHKVKDPFFETFIPYCLSNIDFVSKTKTSTGGW